MRRVLLLAFCANFQIGCSAIDFLSNSSGVGVPAPSAAREYAVETLEGATGQIDGRVQRMTAGAYIIASVAHTNSKCHEFFEVLEKYKQESDFVDKVLTAGIAAGSPLLALVGAPTGKAVARFTSSIAFANMVNKYSADVFAFSSFREPLKEHVFDSMASFQKNNGIDIFFKHKIGISVPVKGTGDLVDIKLSDGKTETISKGGVARFLQSQETEDLMIARTMAADYAALCSLANMKKIIFDALKTHNSSVSPGGPGTPATPTAATTAQDKVTAANAPPAPKPPVAVLKKQPAKAQ